MQLVVLVAVIAIPLAFLAERYCFPPAKLTAISDPTNYDVLAPSFFVRRISNCPNCGANSVRRVTALKRRPSMVRGALDRVGTLSMQPDIFAGDTAQTEEMFQCRECHSLFD